MTGTISSVKRWAAAATVGLGLAVSGCGFDDVELNGSVFNAVGLGQKAKTSEPKLAQRTGLVLPPDPQRLPEPGTQPGSESSDVATLQDPDLTGPKNEAAMRKAQEDYCKVHYEQAKARGEADADAAKGPLGPCRQGILTAIQKSSEEE